MAQFRRFVSAVIAPSLSKPPSNSVNMLLGTKLQKNMALFRAVKVDRFNRRFCSSGVKLQSET